MAVYDANGNQLNAVYDAEGNSLDYAYDADGALIFSKEKHIDYTNYTYTTEWNSKGITAQGFDIYASKLYWASVGNNNDSIPAKCYVWNINDGSQAFTDPYITIYGGHCNNLAFAYPYMYASTGYNPATVYVNRVVNDHLFTLDKTLTFPSLYDIDACIDEYDKSIMWAISHDGIGTELVVSKWNLSELTDNGNGTYTPQELHRVNIPRPSGNYMQGTRMHDGLLWYGCGNGTQRAYVYAVNPITGESMYTIDLETNTEPECVLWIGDNLYVGFQGMMLRKYTFGELTGS